MKIIYRISDNGYKKDKPDYINNKNCLVNFVNSFKKYTDDIYVVADNVSQHTTNLIYNVLGEKNVFFTSIGSSAGTFQYALNFAVKNENILNNEIVYFVENDYLHVPNAPQILESAFESEIVDYVTLYDHPDKYIDGANPFVEYGGEDTKVLLSSECHWKITNSTTMTFAAKKQTLIEDLHEILAFTEGTYPRDFEMFTWLREQKNRLLISPIPSAATHGETMWLAPFFKYNTI